MIAALQNSERSLQVELNVIAPTVIQIELRRVDQPLARPMIKRNGEVIFPMTIARRARIVCNHRRAALGECDSRGAREENRNR
jgi:hypothetical protein